MKDTFIDNVCDTIENNLNNTDFDVQNLANQLFLCREQLYKKLIKLKDQSPTTFLRNYRLKKGKELLVQTDMKIKEIAYQVGFKDPAHFSNAFKELYGMSPKEVR